MRDSAFVKLNTLTSGADYLNRTLADWLSLLSAIMENMKTMDDETKRIMHETLRSLMLMALKNLPVPMPKRQAPRIFGKPD